MVNQGKERARLGGWPMGLDCLSSLRRCRRRHGGPGSAWGLRDLPPTCSCLA